MEIQSNALLSPFFSFKGRITRGDWWCLQIVGNAIFVLGIVFLSYSDSSEEVSLGKFITCLLFNLISLWVFLSATARRFHDRGKSAWNCLWLLLPIIGGIYVLYACGISNNGRKPNKYGPPAEDLSD